MKSRTNDHSKSGRKDGSKIWHKISKKNNPPYLRSDGWMKVTYVDPSIEFLTIALKSQEIGGGWLTDVNLLNKGLKMIVVSLK